MSSAAHARQGSHEPLDDGSAYRIWHQSLIPKDDSSALYYASLSAHARAILPAGFLVDLHGFDPGVYRGRLEPARMARFSLGELVQAHLMVATALRAAREHYSAFAIGVLQDPGLVVARTAVDIPVVGYGQASALIGRCLGDKLGVLAFNPALFPLIRDRINAHTPGFVGPMLDLELSYAEVIAGFSDTALREVLTARCHALIDQGANVIVPGQMLLSELMWHLGIARVDEVPVIDGLGSLLGLATALIALQQVSGNRVTRMGVYWARVDQDIVEAAGEICGIREDEARPST